MFQPTRDQVRAFFSDTWQKYQNKISLSDIEKLALEIILQHPEYQGYLSPEGQQQDFNVESGQLNPFLHLSMHLAVMEQLSVNQPPGIVNSYQSLLKTKEPHEAFHIIIEALGEVLWESQRLGKALDSDVYLEKIRQSL